MVFPPYLFAGSLRRVYSSYPQTGANGCFDNSEIYKMLSIFVSSKWRLWNLTSVKWLYRRQKKNTLLLWKPINGKSYSDPWQTSRNSLQEHDNGSVLVSCGFKWRNWAQAICGLKQSIYCSNELDTKTCHKILCQLTTKIIRFSEVQLFWVYVIKQTLSELKTEF